MNLFKKLHFKTSFKRKLIFYNFIVVTVMIISLGWSAYLISSHEITEKTVSQTSEVLSQTNKSIEYIIAEYEKISDMVFSNRAIIEVLSKEDSEVELTDFNQVMRTIEDYAINTKIDSMLIINNSGRFYKYGSPREIDLQEPQNRLWYKKTAELKGKQFWLVASNNEFTDKNDSKMLTNIRLVNDIVSGRTIGLQIINISLKVLRDVYKEINVENGTSVFLVDSQGIIISHQNIELIGQKINKYNYYQKSIHNGGKPFITSIQGVKSLIISKDVPKINCKLFMLIPYKSLTSGTQYIFVITIFIALGCLIVSFILDLLISKQLTNPIINITNYMKKVENGDLSIRATSPPKEEELLILYDSFNEMVSKVQKLTIDIKVAYKVKRDSEIKALQAQINPHFLYNTLESVNSLAKIYGVHDISNIVLSLSELLRVSIGTGTEVLTIRDEIAHLKSYLCIQSIRYKDKFNTEFDIDESVLEFKIIKLILQPLVENSIFHGIGQLKGTGTITVSIKNEGDFIIFLISDNGIGMTEEQLKSLFDSIAAKEGEIKESRGGYGVKNVNDRLKLFYGDEFGLKYESVLGEGTKVSFCLPKVQQEEEVCIKR